MIIDNIFFLLLVEYSSQNSHAKDYANNICETSSKEKVKNPRTFSLSWFWNVYYKKKLYHPQVDNSEKKQVNTAFRVRGLPHRLPLDSYVTWSQ